MCPRFQQRPFHYHHQGNGSSKLSPRQPGKHPKVKTSSGHFLLVTAASHVNKRVNEDVFPGTLTDSDILPDTVVDTDVLKGTALDSGDLPGTVLNSDDLPGTVLNSDDLPRTVLDSDGLPGTVLSSDGLPGTVLDSDFPPGTEVNNDVLQATVVDNDVLRGNAVDNDHPPGTVVDVVDGKLVVKTATALILLDVAELDGRNIPPWKYQLYGLIPGTRLQNTNSPTGKMMEEIYEQEDFWKAELERYQPMLLTRQKLSSSSDSAGHSGDLTVRSKSFMLLEGTVRTEAESKAEILASFVTFLARITCSDAVHVGMVADKSGIPAQYSDLYSDVIPGIFTVDLHSSRQTAFANCFRALQRIAAAKTFPRDLFFRYKYLRQEGVVMLHNFIVMATENALEAEADIPASKILQYGRVSVLLSPSEMRVMYADGSAQERQILDALKHYPVFYDSLFSLSPDDSLLDVQLLRVEDLARLYPLPQPQTHQPDLDLFSLFLQQARQSPYAVALRSSEGQMTYAELEKTVGDLAALIEENLPECYKVRKHCIGLHLPKSMAYVQSALACVRAGFPFLPLPVDLPEDRMKFMLQDADVRVMIISESKAHSSDILKQLPDAKVLFEFQCADQRIVMMQLGNMDGQLISDRPPGHDTFEEHVSEDSMKLPNQRIALEEQCCYVIYTSGSTGRPKGVQVRVSGVINMCKALIADLDLQPTDTTAQFASIGFDTSIWEIFPTLLSGGTLAVLRENERLGREFVKVIADLQVNVLTLTPSVLSHYSPADLPTATKLVAAGETCMLHTAFKWTLSEAEGSCKPVRFFNSYGPTETTVGATMYEFKREDYPDDSPAGELAIGRAMSGVIVYLLDEFQKPVPPGVVGQIHIGGAGVSGGYIGHAADQNAFRFVDNPFVDQVGDASSGTRSLLYKSGDHAFQDIDGRLTFVGRLDNQVKIRGHRVDLGEIEQVMMQHRFVETAVVVKHKCKTSPEPSLAAFVAPSSVRRDELMESLSRMLPRFMLPNFIKMMEVQNFPMSVNGKVNRAALEADETVHDFQLDTQGCRLTDARLTMAQIWCRIFGLDEHAIGNMSSLSSFSAHGGSSLHLVILQQAIEETFHVTLTIDDMLAADTIQQFCDLVSKAKKMPRKSVTSENSADKARLRETILNDCNLMFDEETPSLRLGLNNKYSGLRPDEKIILTSPPCIQNGDHSCLNREGEKPSNSQGLTRDTDPQLEAEPCTDPDQMTFLLSGVTGFLGAFLLYEILNQTKARVVCLVRATSSSHARGRLVSNMSKYSLWQESYVERLVVLVADVSEVNLGMKPEDYRTVCSEVDAIIINAAKVNFNTSYYDHRKTNVLGTKEFIRVAMTGRKKFVYLISSLSVFLFPPEAKDGVTPPRMMKEEDAISDPLHVEGGYGQSKWVSEQLVLKSLSHLPGGAIFRPGHVTGTSTDGVGPRDDILARCIVGMRSMGSVPDVHLPFDLLPVDYCSRAVVEIVKKCTRAAANGEKTEQRIPNVYNLYNHDTIPFKDLFTDSQLRILPLEEWRRELKRLDNNPHLTPLTPFFLSPYWERARCFPTFCTCNTKKHVTSETAQLLKPAQELLPLYKRFLGIRE